MHKITLAILTLLLVSCSETKMLQLSLRKYNSSIAYLHDSPTLNCPRNKQVSVNIHNTPLDTVTSVSKLSSLVLPFIIFDYFDTQMKVKLGQSSIQEDYNDFFTGSLTDESKRSGCFSVSDQIANDSVYTLDLTIDSCNTISKYRKNFTFMFLLIAYTYSYSESGSPAETNLQVSAKFSKGSSLIYEKKYSIKRTQPFINPSRWNSNKLRADFTTNMVEGLSLSTKECIEQIVADINTSLYGSARPVMQIEQAPGTANQVQEVLPVEEEQPTVTEKKSTPKDGSVKNQLRVGDNVKFYNFKLNNYQTGVVKEIKDETIIIEYVSFGKIKIEEVNKNEIKQL